MQRRLIFLLLLSLSIEAIGQTATIRGQIKDELGNTLPSATVIILQDSIGTTADPNGRYELIVPAERPIEIRYSFAGLLPWTERIELQAGEERKIDVSLRLHTLKQVEVEGTRRQRERGVEPIDPRLTRFNPSPLGGVESLLQGQIGVMMRNELSSGYSVRGGNFDENLVYVNDIEVYRPFLVRAGQQEGLSFPNPDMIERLEFSAGGFEARYGDKMSSVLDIQYKRPRQFGGSAMIGLLGGAVHVEDAMMKKRLRHITGFRHRVNQLLLSGSDTQGEYRPVYTDLQSYWTYDITDNIELGFLGLYSSNRYGLVPQNRETEFGTFNQALRFTVYFEGQEVTQFQTYFGAFNLNVQATRNTLLKFTLSSFKTFETERFDVLAEYYLDELERDLGSDQFGEVVRNLGVGGSLDHARNDLDATVYSFAHKGFHQHGDQYLQWGADVKSELINDKLSEWNLIDSAGYSIPLNQGDDLELNYVLKSRLNMESIRASAYVQNTWRWESDREDRWWTLIAGVRGQHWTFNGQSTVSPRIRLTFNPGWTTIDANGDTIPRDYSFWFATGSYYQPPFYREVRRMDGTLNPDIRAQHSIHFLLGMDRRLKFWDRPFKLTTELYYKQLNDLIPYEVDNIRIRYYGTNNARGFATGIDMKLNGEFIEGIESWVGASVMTIQEDITDDQYYVRYNEAGDVIYPGYTFDQVAIDSTLIRPGYIPRPTDQRVNFALFFQDEMPRWPTFKVHLNLVFGTGLPFGPPNFDRFSDTLRTSIYRRVDIGFSKQFIGAEGQRKPAFLKGIHNMWLSLEVFNLLNIDNTIDHTWVTDVSGRYYSIPDFLTPRRFNLKLIAWF